MSLCMHVHPLKQSYSYNHVLFGSDCNVTYDENIHVTFKVATLVTLINLTPFCPVPL